ncbi:diguanylate cyclase [Candidatus Woesearchaeota archaeon]|nr:diguanylate cyclase [Candidatus Woesearchaeota archaeon]
MRNIRRTIQPGGGKPIIRPHDLEDKTRHSILVVASEHDITDHYTQYLYPEGYERIYTASSVLEAQDILERTIPDITIVDLDRRFEGPVTGIELIEQIVMDWDVPTNFLVVSEDVDTITTATDQWAMDYILAPFGPQNLCLRVKKSIVDSIIRKGSTTDLLTGLTNKQVFLDQLHREISGFHRDPSEPVSVVSYDIDRFKRINDTYGHVEGDRVLIEVGAQARRILRAKDIKSRCGGEEFGVLMAGTPFKFANLGYNRFADYFRSNPQRLRQNGGHVDEIITFSAGIATLTEEIYCNQLAKMYDLKTDEGVREVAERMLECADKGLYFVKKNGRTGVYEENAFALLDEILGN